MPFSVITSKGQITVPKSIRDALQLDKGVRVQFRLRDDGIVEMTPETGDLLTLCGSLTPPKRKHVSVDEMKRAIREGGSRA